MKFGEHPVFAAMSPIRILSESIVCPSQRPPAGGKSRCELSPWDLALLSFRNIKYGHLFSFPSGAPTEAIVERVTSSLSISPLSASAKAGELLSRGVGWAARMIHDAVASHTDEAIREKGKTWMEAPVVYPFSLMENFCMFMGSSPRFDKYGCDFGWGKAVAVRSGNAEKYDGMILVYPGREGGGSIDLEVSLSPEAMALLELDPELSRVASSDYLLSGGVCNAE